MAFNPSSPASLVTDNGTGQEPCYDAGNDEKPGQSFEQLGEHSRRLQCFAEDVHRYPGTHVQCGQGTGTRKSSPQGENPPN